MAVDFGVVVPSWGHLGDPEAIRRLTRAAEELDYSTAWFGDPLLLPSYATRLSPANWYETLTCCIHGLAMTSRIRCGTDVLVLPYRDPRLLAKMASTADQLSGGRLTLGVGVGFLRGEFEALEVPDYAYAPPVPRNADGRAYFVGSEAEIRSDIEALAAAGVQHFALRFWSGDPEMGVEQVLDQMQRFARGVRTHFGTR